MMILIVYIYLLDGLLFILLLRLLSAMVRRDALTQQYSTLRLLTQCARNGQRQVAAFLDLCAL